MNSLVLVVFFVVGGCLADVSHLVDKTIPILKDDRYEAPDGSYQYSFETGNQIQTSAQGAPDGAAVQGGYSYVAPEGNEVRVTYIADADGYRPEGSVLPVPPPTPEPILRALKYIKEHPYKGDDYPEGKASNI